MYMIKRSNCQLLVKRNVGDIIIIVKVVKRDEL